MRGAPGNTINHTTSYWIPNHSPKVFVEKVDVVSGVGYDRAAALGEPSNRFHEIRRVISNLGVFDFETPDHAMRLRSVHAGVTPEQVVENTSFELVIESATFPKPVLPSAEELRIRARNSRPEELPQRVKSRTDSGVFCAANPSLERSFPIVLLPAIPGSATSSASRIPSSRREWDGSPHRNSSPR